MDVKVLLQKAIEQINDDASMLEHCRLKLSKTFGDPELAALISKKVQKNEQLVVELKGLLKSLS